MLNASTALKRTLRAQAPRTFPRGETYWRDGHVLAHQGSLRVVGGRLEGDLEGQVRGTHPYHVRVRVRAGLVAADCTCPADVMVCKHAVAVVLAHLERGAEPAAPRRSEAPPVDVPSTADELTRWAVERGVSYYLQVEATVLLARLQAASPLLVRQLLPGLATVPLRAVAVLRAATGALRPELVTLAELARVELAAEAERVARAVAEEEEPPPPLLEREAAPLAEALIAARRAVRRHASPLPRAWRAQQELTVDPRLGVARWRDGRRVFLESGRPSAAEAELACVDGAVRLRCTCQRGDPRCEHALALLDTALDALRDPARRELAAELARELARPAWARALEELGAVAAQAAPEPRAASIEVWWRIEDELGRLTLTPVVRKLGRGGARSPGARRAPARLLLEHGDALDPVDREIAEHLLDWSERAHARESYPARAFAAALGHPRLTSELTGGEPVALVRGALGFTAALEGAHLRLEPAFQGARFEPRVLSALLTAFHPDEPLLTVDPGEDRYLMIDVSLQARRVWEILERHGDTFPPESHAPLLEQLAALDSSLPLALPREILGRRIDGEERVVVRLRLLPDSTLELELFCRPAPGAPLYLPGVGPRDVLVPSGDERRYVRRDLASEPERAQRVLDALPLAPAEREEGPPGCHRIAELEPALRLVAALDPPPEGVVAEWLGPRPQLVGTLGAKQLRVAIDHSRDWFGISGDVKHEGGRLELAVLLDAARQQQRYVRVGEHRWVELAEALRARLRAIDARTFAKRSGRELSLGAVAAIAELAADGAEVTAAPAWRALSAKFAAAAKLRPRPPASLRATLRDYQRDGHAWLSRLAAWGMGACLADDMGLGKTVQAIAVLLDRKRHGPALVVAPTSVCWNWVAELARFAPGLQPVLYVAEQDRAARLAKLTSKDVVIVSYGLLVRDAETLAARRFATLILDEAQAVKNASTQRAAAARALRADFRVALSGTPMENHLGELWSLFAILCPGLLGSWEQFRDRYAVPIERGIDPAPREELAAVLRPFLLRRTKQEVARELPTRTEIQVSISLSHEEARLYEDARLAAVAHLTSRGEELPEEQRRFQVLAALTRLRLVASHPKLYEPTSKVASSKLRRLVELLSELRAEGHRALVFSQFTSHLALVREELDAAGLRTLYLDGATSATKRQRLIEAFQRGDADAFLISLKAGGTGVNLTAADYVIHLDPWWNPAVEDQATDRAHRIGQTKPVTVYRLIARGTIEEKILALHAEKRALVAGVLDGSSAAARLSTRELADLIAGGPLAAEADED